MTTKMQVFISKHALSKGILLREVNSNDGNGLIRCSALPGSTTAGYAGAYIGEGIEWHRTSKGAIARAKKMRKRHLAQMVKIMNKIKAIDFGGDHS